MHVVANKHFWADIYLVYTWYQGLKNAIKIAREKKNYPSLLAPEKYKYLPCLLYRLL